MRVFVIAGEASGDKLGAALMTGLASLVPDITFAGVGGPLMQAQGLQSRFPMDELSVMGVAEILPKYRALKARVHDMAQAVLDTKPDALVTIDSPDFGLRVAKLVKAGSDIAVCIMWPRPCGRGGQTARPRWPSILIRCWRYSRLSRRSYRPLGCAVTLSGILWSPIRWQPRIRLLLGTAMAR